MFSFIKKFVKSGVSPVGARKSTTNTKISEVLQQFEKNSTTEATANPFLNFMADVRANVCIPVIAAKLWNRMSEEQKLPYRESARKVKLKRLQAHKRKCESSKWRFSPPLTRWGENYLIEGQHIIAQFPRVHFENRPHSATTSAFEEKPQTEVSGNLMKVNEWAVD
uniref:HMG box domain-containing protein n=1 Tax=Glossina pallidipes TaxID=7398 RepID=A0A1A9ZTR4_GLOPL